MLQRAVIFIAVGMLVILAMELAPEATAHFGIWFGITGGLTTLLDPDGDKESVGAFLDPDVYLLLSSE
jgi:hypothetical protein